MSVCATGGQGCVFYPELDCTDPLQNHASRNKYVSKLQTDYNTVFEYSIISYLKKVIPEYVPEYEQYTVLHNITKCVPSLSRKDIQKICPKCTIPYKNKAVVSMLNMPYKGVSIDKSIRSPIIHNLWNSSRYTTLNKIYTKAIEYYTNPSIPPGSIREYLSDPDIVEYIHIEYTFKTLHIRLINIFNNLIKVINSLGIYHSDIKPDNILIDLSNNPTVFEFHRAPMHVIDWGITNTPVNSVINLNRSLGVLLLDPDFMGYFNRYSKSAPVDTIVYTYFNSNPIDINGHVNIINESLNILTGISIGYVCGLHPAWFYHLVEWLKYIQKNKYPFNYITSVVMHNKDIVGIISVYVMIYTTIYYKYVIPTQTLRPNVNTTESTQEPLYKYYIQLGKFCVDILIHTYDKLNHDYISNSLYKMNDLLKTSL